MEDEECLPENSGLNLYLQNLGFSDLQVTKNAPQNPTKIRFEISKSKSTHLYVETIDADIIEQINVIVSSRMLFEEDISNVEKLLSHFKIVKNGIIKSMFKDEVGFAVIFLGLALYWVIGYYAFFIVSSFYAYKAADYLKRNHFHRTRLSKLISILQANYNLLKKTVKFIEENRLLQTSSEGTNISTEFIEGFDYYKNFKSDFLIMLNEMIYTLVKSTQKLINNIPLYDYIENPEYYLCNNLNENYEYNNLSKLYEIYLLVQSEFLQRLILSLIPNIQLSNKNSFHELNKILTETCVSSLKIKNKLNKKFKFIFLNGIHSPKVEFKLPFKNQTCENKYFEDFLLNIHETSKTFQNLLLQSRIIEDNLKSETIPELVEKKLVNIQSDLNMCQRNVNDCIILLKKANAVEKGIKNCEEVKVQDRVEVETSVEGVNKIMIGYTDLDPKVEDEVFEAYLTSENTSDHLEDDLWDLEDKMKKKLEKEYSKTVMEELKVKLIEKDKDWKKREKELLRKKGLIDESEDFEDHENNSNAERLDEKKENLVKLEEPNSVCQNKTTESELNHKMDDSPLNTSEKNNGVRKLSLDSQKSECDTGVSKSLIDHTDVYCPELVKNSQEDLSESESLENNNGTSILAFNKSLLSDLNQARQKIFNSSFPVEEEVFCASSDDESNEGDMT